MQGSASRVGVAPLLAVWALLALAYTLKAALGLATTPLILDTDDAMRLVEVHDFLAGQNWFDLVQHRLNTPWGTLMHWSRMVDLPEAALLLLLRPLFGAATDTIAAYAWPLMLLVVLLWLTAKLALRLGGRAALWPALLLPALSLITFTEFSPGRFDHHSAQILLTLALLYCLLLARERSGFAALAGLFAAAAIAIGIEGLPMTATGIAIVGLAWVVDARQDRALRQFGLGFATATALAFAIGVDPARWLELRLDAISIVYALAALLCGTAFVVLSLLPLRTKWARLAAALVAAAIALALLLRLDPALLAGPYAALDPWLVANWLAHISEAESFVQSFAADPLYPLGVTLPVLLALGVAIWNGVRRTPRRAAWLTYAAFLIAGLAIMVVQIRAARIVTPLAVPADAVLVAALWRRNLDRPALAPALGALAAAVAASGFAIAVIVALLPLAPPAAGAAGRNACLAPAAFAPLAALPPQRVMAPVDLGSHLLLFTPHAVVAAPYHRDQQGLLDTFRFFDAPISEARAILTARGIGLVVVCPAMREIRGALAHAPDSFVSLFAAGKLPPWLVDISPPGAALTVYRVTPR